MEFQDAEKHYTAARKLALKEYMKNVSNGHMGYLPFLEGVLKNVDIISEINIGLVEIPLKKIIGTYTHSRSISFAHNFMPLLPPSTEFAQKWKALCGIHLSEGIREPIKVYEYLNWFYVIEGNKRVSVLKYFDGYSIPGKVARLLPRKDENNPETLLYYEFLEFNKKTGINCIWFSRPESFRELTRRLEKLEPPNRNYEDRFAYFVSSIYLVFRKIYHELGGGQLPITTGDAFLEYVRIYGMPSEIDEENLRQKLRLFLTELEQMSRDRTADIQTRPAQEQEAGLISAIGTLVWPKRKLKAAFIYAKNARQSGWTYSHEMGRAHVEKTLKEQVETVYFDETPEGDEAYDILKKAAESGNDIIFATSPAFLNATLKAALEYPGARFLNCSETHSYKHVNTYFGRIYEARFLAGVAAGAATRSDVIGYVGTNPVPGVVSGINAFALGARMVNPSAKVRVAWTNAWDDGMRAEEASSRLIQSGADIISHHDTLSNREFSDEYGVYTVVCNIDKKSCAPNEYIAVPVWNWGIFYERILRSILNETWKNIADIVGKGHKPINFWWGMDSGIVDFFYSRRLVPRETQKLLELLKRMIISGDFHPFTGPVCDIKGKVRIKRGSTATYGQISGMDWFVDGVEAE